MNLAQPFSSGAEGPAAHTLEPTSLEAPGAADIGFTGSSKTAVHVVPARGRYSSQEQQAHYVIHKGEAASHGDG